MFGKEGRGFYIALLVIFLVLLTVLIFLIRKGKVPNYQFKNEVSSSITEKPEIIYKSPPEISGWIAWWKEKEAYDLVVKVGVKSIRSISPVWYMVSTNLELLEVGQNDKKEVVNKYKDKGIIVLPTLGSELSGKKLTPFFTDNKKTKTLSEKLTTDIIELGADGLDIDLEGIELENKELYESFLVGLSGALKSNNLYLSVTIHAQTSTPDWEGVLGQDIKNISEIADEVRIMTYDYHSGDSDAGHIAPLSWLSEVAKHNLSIVTNKNKLVFGIPSYGYVWGNAETKGLQYDEFERFIDNVNYTSERDADSGELIIKSLGFTGYLSDSESMIRKIDLLRSLGINKFVIWHLGGMDEKFFETQWSN